MSEVKGPTRSSSGSRTAHFLLCPRGGRGEGAFWDLLYKGANPIYEGFTLLDLFTSQKAPSPLGFGISIYDWGGGTNIQSFALFCPDVFLTLLKLQHCFVAAATLPSLPHMLPPFPHPLLCDYFAWCYQVTFGLNWLEGRGKERERERGWGIVLLFLASNVSGLWPFCVQPLDTAVCQAAFLVQELFFALFV